MDADATDHDSIGWEWDAVPGVDGYQAQFSTSQPFVDTDDLFTVNGTSYRADNLAAKTNGYLRVRSVEKNFLGTGSDVRRSEWSAPSTGTTGAAPEPDPLDAPANFESTAQGDDSISLAWDSVDGADYYEVEQRAEDGDWVDASCDGGDNEVEETVCEATGLDEVTEYDFRVSAVPSSADTQRRASGWATLNNVETTGTRPTPPPTTVPGSEGNLNIFWESDADSITWRWDQVADRTWKYQVHYMEQLYDSKANPCPNPDLSYSDTTDETSTTANGWDAADADGFATRHEHETDLVAGDVALLCVQTVREAARGQTQYGNLSFAWVATTPVAPSNAPTFREPDSKTTAITWAGVTFDRGFSYPVRLVSAPPVEEDSGTSAVAAVPNQAACEAGKPLKTEDSGNRAQFSLSAYDVTGLDDYTSYYLCYRAQNDDGSSRSEWAISTGGVTLPPQPSSISGVPSTVDHDADLEWSFAIPGTGHPQEQSSYTIRVIEETGGSLSGASGISRPTPKVQNCELNTAVANSANTEIFAAPIAGPTTSRTRTHIGIVHSATNSSAVRDKRYYLCVQSKLTNDRAGKWRLSGAVTQRKDPDS